jgi:hypothetical protein
VHLQDERGTDLRVIADSEMLLPALLRKSEVGGSVCLRFVLPYADTTFNHAQVSILLGELAGLRPNLDERTRVFVDSVIGLAEEAERDTHLYLKFIGD